MPEKHTPPGVRTCTARQMWNPGPLRSGRLPRPARRGGAPPDHRHPQPPSAASAESLPVLPWVALPAGHRLGQHGAPARDQRASYLFLVDQGTGGDGAVRERRGIADAQKNGQVGRCQIAASQPVEQPSAQPSAAGHQIAQRLQGMGCAALTPGEMVQPDQSVIRMVGREDVGTDLDQHLGELSGQPAIHAPLVDPFAEVFAVGGVRETAGERLYRSLRPGSARSLGAPPFGERGECLRPTGPQVLTRQPGHQSVADIRHEMRVIRLDDPPGPRAEVGPQVGHVVPEMDADGGVVVQLGEPYATVRSGAGRDLRQPLGEILALEERSLRLRVSDRAQQKRGRPVNDVGVCAVQHGHGDQQGALGGLG